MLNPPKVLVSQPIASSFDAVCSWYGDETAVTGRGGIDDVGFSELQAHSCAVAAQLYHRYGVRSNDRVAMMCGSDAPAAQAATMLACSRIGSPWVPLDDSWAWTQSQLATVLADAEPIAAVVVGDSDESTRALLLSSLGLSRIVFLNHDGSLVLPEAMDVLEDLPDPPPHALMQAHKDISPLTSSPNEPNPGPPLSIIYTSGSQGAPKGVIASHAGLLNRIAWQRDAFPFQSGDCVCSRSPATFVDSIAETLCPLLAGVGLWSPTAENTLQNDPTGFISSASAVGVTHITLIPSLLQVVLRVIEAGEAEWGRLRVCFVSGEATSPLLVRSFARLFKRTQLVNLYGSTEVSGDCSYAILYDGCGNEDGVIGSVRNAIDFRGVPISTSVAMRGTHLRVVTKGSKSSAFLENNNISVIEGELQVSGPGLALGYWNRPNEQALRFSTEQQKEDTKYTTITKDSSIEVGVKQRWFTTGDLVRWDNGAGQLFWLGRVDDQVKVRGVRVELLAIEAAVATALGAGEQGQVAVVVEPGKMHLVAFVTADVIHHLETSSKGVDITNSLPASCDAAASSGLATGNALSTNHELTTSNASSANPELSKSSELTTSNEASTSSKISTSNELATSIASTKNTVLLASKESATSNEEAVTSNEVAAVGTESTNTEIAKNTELSTSDEIATRNDSSTSAQVKVTSIWTTIRERLGACLAGPSLPSVVLRLDGDLPRTASGKIDRVTLTRVYVDFVQADSTNDDGGGGDGDDMDKNVGNGVKETEQCVRSAFQEIVPLWSTASSSSATGVTFEQIGGDSMVLIQLLWTIKYRFHVSLTRQQVQSSSFENLVGLVLRKQLFNNSDAKENQPQIKKRRTELEANVNDKAENKEKSARVLSVIEGANAGVPEGAIWNTARCVMHGGNEYFLSLSHSSIELNRQHVKARAAVGNDCVDIISRTNAGSVGIITDAIASAPAVDNVEQPNRPPSSQNGTVQSESLNPEWKCKLLKCVDASPLLISLRGAHQDSVVEAELAVVGSHGGDVCCVNLESGERVWTAQVWGRIGAAVTACTIPPPTGNGSITSAETDATRAAILVSTYSPSDDKPDMADWYEPAEPLTQTQIEAAAAAPVVVQENGRGALYAFDLVNGCLLWCCTFAGEVKSSAVVDVVKGVVWLGVGRNEGVDGSSDQMCCLELLKGKMLGSVSIPGPVYGTPMLLNNNDNSKIITSSLADIVACTTSGSIVAISLSSDKQNPSAEFSCEIQWTADIGAPIYGSPCLLPSTNSPTKVSICNNNNNVIVVSSVDGNLHCINSLTGTTLQTCRVSYKPIFGAPVVSPTIAEPYRMIVGSHDGNLCAVRVGDRKQEGHNMDDNDEHVIWKTQLDAVVFASSCVFEFGGECLVVAATTSGHVYVLNGIDGAVRASVRVEGEVFSGPVVHEQLGLVVFGSRDDHMYVFSLDKLLCK